MVFFLIFLMRAVDVTTGPAASSSGTWDGKCPDQNAAQVCLASGKVRGAWPGQYNHHVCTTSPRNHTPHHQPVSHQNSAQPRHRPQPAESCGHAGGKMGIKRRGAAPVRPRGAGRVCCGRGRGAGRPPGREAGAEAGCGASCAQAVPCRGVT